MDAVARSAALLLAACGLVGSQAPAQVTQIVSISSGAVQANSDSSNSSVSANGRYVAFQSNATNLVPGDTNGVTDVFVHDRLGGTTTRVSVASGGAQANSHSYFGSIPADGRWVSFDGSATNLVAGDTNGRWDIFVHDRASGSTERVSVASNGTQGNEDSFVSAISADGRYVAFASSASNLVAGDTNIFSDIFLRDRLSGTTQRVSVATGGAQGDFVSYEPSISADGRYVAFRSASSNLVAGDTNAADDIFVRDHLNGTTERVSLSSAGLQGNFGCLLPSISADGRYVAFQSDASNLVLGDTNPWTDVFVHDRQTGKTELVSFATGGAQGNYYSLEPSISADGRYVTFFSQATNLVAGDTNDHYDVFVHDRASGTTDRVSVSTSGAEGNHDSVYPAISADGRYVVFESGSSNLVATDVGLFYDIFIHDRSATWFTSLCDPGLDGVIPCPCSNPPAGPGRGCDNSSASGGASLTASGIAYISMDSLVFSTAGETPGALSILFQGNAAVVSGLAFGQGVRCVGGATIRLFTKIAQAGSISVPDPGAGDPSISARSATQGDPIHPGQSRWYSVAYRDPGLLGGCSPTSAFNVSQTVRVTWSP